MHKRPEGMSYEEYRSRKRIEDKLFAKRCRQGRVLWDARKGPAKAIETDKQKENNTNG